MRFSSSAFAPFAGPRHGQNPSAVERRRLGVAGAVAGAAACWIVGGGGAAFVAGIAGALLLPRVATWRRVRYGRRVGAGAAGRALDVRRARRGGSIRAAPPPRGARARRPIAIELRRAAVELEAGASLDALDDLIARAPRDRCS